ncbi:MAG: hypothetical protein ACTSRW_16150 [Candidatus Helarchaeota archaeon]
MVSNLQLYLDPSFTYILVAIFIPLLILVFYFVLGRDYKSEEFKIAAGMLAAIAILVVLVIFDVGTMHNDLFVTIITIPPGVGFIIVAIWLRNLTNNSRGFSKYPRPSQIVDGH